MRRMLAMLLVVMALISLCACGDVPQGVYTCYEMESMGYVMSPDDVWEDDCTIALKKDGMGTIHMDGEDALLTFEITGDVIQVHLEGETAFGTLKDGLMELELLGLTMRLARRGVTPPTPAQSPEEADPNAVFSEPVSDIIGGYLVTVQAAELFTDEIGNSIIRVYFDFTNTSDKIICNSDEVFINATQNGFSLADSYTEDEDRLPEHGNWRIHMIPGTTIRTVSEYVCEPEYGIVEFTIKASESQESLSVWFDPQNLPGRPEPLPVVPILEPVYTEGLPSEGVLEDLYPIKILGHEVVLLNGEYPTLCVHVEFTNNSKEETNFSRVVNDMALQDGLALNPVFPFETVEGSENSYENIEPGQTIRATACFALESDSPVEFLIRGRGEECVLGLMIPVA